MQKQVQKRRLFDRLPQYGKQLLRALDSTHQLDRLQCNICSDYFNFDNKKPIVICPSKTCSYQHGICEDCFNDILKSRRSRDLQETPLKCSFCQQLCQERFVYDESRFELIKKLSTVTETLTEISANAKQVTEKETQKKLKEIVERAQRDIFKTSLESKRKTFLLNRLQTRIKSAYSQNERIVKEVQQRQQDLVRRQNDLKRKMEDIMNHQRQLEDKNTTNLQLIIQLRKQNEDLKKKLSQYQDMQNLQSRTIPKQRSHKRQKILYHSDYYFHQFRFMPRRDESFLQNFKEDKETHLVQLKRERQKYFNTIGQKKIVYHSQLFNIENEEHKLICFQLNSHNKRVSQYKFGLADQHFKQIKNASISINTLQAPENQPLIITFYVNLTKMKLYATTSNVRRSQDLPKKLSLSKFTVFLYFFDINTQLTFQN